MKVVKLIFVLLLLSGGTTLSAQSPQVGDLDFGGVVVHYDEKTDNVLVLSFDENVDTRWEEAKGWVRTMGLGNRMEWRLPDIKELTMIYNNQEALDAALSMAGQSGLSDHYYWSNSEYETYRAWYVKVGVASKAKPRTSKFSARAVRSFILSTSTTTVTAAKEDDPLLRLNRR